MFELVSPSALCRDPCSFPENSWEYFLVACVLIDMQLFYRVAADCIVLVHMTYVLVVVVGLPVTWVGILCRAKWARNFWWRCGHLAMISIVVIEALLGITCPLTTWEFRLRELAEEQTYRGAFVANLIHEWLFVSAEPWVLALCYSSFGSLVLASFFAAPPRWPSFRNPTTTS